MSQVIQTNCNYKIKTQASGSIILDTNPVPGNPGTVIITGDLQVDGEQITVNVTDLFIEDNIIRLNIGETGNGVTKIYSGIEVDRGFDQNENRNLFATLWFNETTDSWEIVKQRDGLVRFDDSTLKLRRITTDQLTDEGDLILIGSGTGVVKVLGTTNYEAQVTNDDDIPNKRYVDLSVRNREPNNRIQRDNTFVRVQDVDGGAKARAIMQLEDISINQGGLNYEPNDEIYITSGIYSDVVVIRVLTVDQDGRIQTIEILDSGKYTTLPTSNTSAPTTTNSTFGSGATVDVLWNVVEVEIINRGNDYESADVFFSINELLVGEVAATGTPVIDNDPLSQFFRQIVSVTIISGGIYQSIPTVTFSAGTTSAITESQVIVVVEDSPSAIFYADRVEIGGLEIIDNAIVTKAGRTNDNIILDPNGTGKVEINYGIQLNNAEANLTSVSNSTVIFRNSVDTTSLTAITASSVTNRLTLLESSTALLKTNQPIAFTGSTFGGIAANRIYYVKSIVSLNQITLSASSGGPTLELIDGSGSMTLNFSGITEGGSTVYYNSVNQDKMWTQWVTNNNNFTTTNLTLNPVRNELISKNKALVYSMLF